MRSRRTAQPTQKVKERFFVRVASEDGEVSFFDATDHIGKKMPFKDPKATLAMRVDDSSIGFSLLHTTKKTAKSVADNPVELPRGPLARLARKAQQVEKTVAPDLSTEQLVLEIDNEFYLLDLHRDEAGVVTLQDPTEDEDREVALPKSALRVGLYLHSPAVGRTVGVSFIGFLGKPNGPETLVRVASQILYSMSQVVEFRILANLETVDVPRPTTAWSASAQTQATTEEASFVYDVRLYTEENPPALAKEGTVGVTIDLEHANPTTGRLLYQLHPDESLADEFPRYRAAFEQAVTLLLVQHLDEEDIAGITYDIVLGSVTTETVGRLMEALTSASGIDVTPSQFQLRVPQAA